MKIAIIGYGRMGRKIEELAISLGHTIEYKIGSKEDLSKLKNKNVDVAIEFSSPQCAYENIKFCLDNRIPIVSGTTGWLDEYDKITNHCIEKKGTFLYASNFSLGVNIFFKLNSYLSKIMKNHRNYNAEITEIHHTKKLDKPSGTAITIADEVINSNTKYDGWTMDDEAENKLKIESLRQGEVPGTHLLKYSNEIDEISIKHEAKNRDGFAMGAIIGAEWIKDKIGVFSMDDILQLK